MSADWPALTSTLNDPVDEALFLGDDLQSAVGNGLVQLATLTLEVKQSAVTQLSGIIKVVTYVQTLYGDYIYVQLHATIYRLICP